MIKNLHREENRWFWRTDSNQGVYYTDKNGQGIFYQSDRTGEEKQLVGTCQFSACETVSGMRRKLNKLFDGITEDPAMLRNRV